MLVLDWEKLRSLVIRKTLRLQILLHLICIWIKDVKLLVFFKLSEVHPIEDEIAVLLLGQVGL